MPPNSDTGLRSHDGLGGYESGLLAITNPWEVVSCSSSGAMLQGYVTSDLRFRGWEQLACPKTPLRATELAN